MSISETQEPLEMQEVMDKIVYPLEQMLHDIHKAFGTSKALKLELENDSNNKVISMDVEILDARAISPKLPLKAKKWPPRKVKEELFPVLQAILG